MPASKLVPSLPERTCIRCASSFVPAKVHQRYCSLVCYRSRVTTLPAPPAPLTAVAVCPVCGESFVSSPDTRTRYCSVGCYVRRSSILQGQGPLSAFIVGELRRRGMTQSALAEALSISASELGYIVAGRTELDRTVRSKLRATFGDAVPLAPEPTNRCYVCHKEYVPKRPGQRQIVCSPVCAASLRRRHKVAKSPLAQLIFDAWRESGQALNAYARLLGLRCPATLRNLIRGRNPTDRTYEQLRATFGERLPLLVTESERRRQRFAAIRPMSLAAMHAPAAKAKSAASRRGLKRSPEAIANQLASARLSGRWRNSVEAMTRYQRTPRGKSLAALRMFLRFTPKPSNHDVQQWTDATAGKLGLTPEAVRALWRQTLVQRGLRQAGGRPARDRRYKLVDLAMKRWPKTPGGYLADGFWDKIADKIQAVERSDIDPAALQTGYYRWKRKPPED